MSLLEAIRRKKQILKSTETTVTQADGSTYIENKETRHLPEGLQKHTREKRYGFVVDLKPDNIPVEILPGLFIGSQDCTEETVVKSYKFTNILSVEIDSFTSLKKLHIPCLDLPETNIQPILNQTNAYIKKVLDENGVLLIHCNAGVSRSAMVVIGYLIQERNMSFLDAFELVKLKRPCIQPNAGFIKQLKLCHNSD